MREQAATNLDELERESVELTHESNELLEQLQAARERLHEASKNGSNTPKNLPRFQTASKK